MIDKTLMDMIGVGVAALEGYLGADFIYGLWNYDHRKFEKRKVIGPFSYLIKHNE